MIPKSTLPVAADPTEEYFRCMHANSETRKVLGFHHNGYQVGLRADVRIDSEEYVVYTGNYKPEKGEHVTRICAEQLFLSLMATLQALGIDVYVEHIFLCAEPRPEKDRNSRFGARTPCDSCLETLAESTVISKDTKWTLHNPSDPKTGKPDIHLNITNQVLLRECA